MGLSGNKGEWSEVYALLKLLADEKLYAGDENLEKLEDFCYSVISIIRENTDSKQSFSYNGDMIVVEYGGKNISIKKSVFIEFSQKLFDSLTKKTDNSEEIKEISKFLSSFGTTQLKAKSTSKSDIRIILNDPKNHKDIAQGYSIKSQIGSASTLLNASRSTNITYKVFSDTLLSQAEVDRINTLEIRPKLRELKKINCKLEFYCCDSPRFNYNLRMLDSGFPLLLAEAVFIYFSTEFRLVKDIVAKIEELDPLKIGGNADGAFYKYKFKHFLTSIAVGMMPGKEWNGVYDATGGYLIVKEDGELVCYHLYDRNLFENYLFVNTKFETASTSRNEFGNLYLENQDCFMKLNLQIRFLK